MELFDYCNIESDSFPDSAPPPQILGSSGPHGCVPTRVQWTDTLVNTLASRLENWSRERAEKRKAKRPSEQLCPAPPFNRVRLQEIGPKLAILPNTRFMSCSRVANSDNRSTYRYRTESFG